MSCPHCAGTGSRSKDLYGYLDCTDCNAPAERAALEAWAKSEALECGLVDAWRLYQLGKAAAAAKHVASPS